MAPKSVLITGCSAGGIGYALAEEFQSRGLHVFATARTRSKTTNLENLPNVTFIPLDITNPSMISAAVDIVSAHNGGTLDYLVNNAGYLYVMPTLDVNIDDAKKLFDVNLWGALAVSQAFAPLLIAAKGTIVNISSISSRLCLPWFSISSASKAALSVLSETLRLELAPLGVNVVTVETGTVRSMVHIKPPEVKLPSNSRYLSIEKTIAARARGEDGISRMETRTYAAMVVDDVLNRTRGTIWRGGSALFARWASALLPAFVLDAILVRGNGLDSV